MVFGAVLLPHPHAAAAREGGRGVNRRERRRRATFPRSLFCPACDRKIPMGRGPLGFTPALKARIALHIRNRHPDLDLDDIDITPAVLTGGLVLRAGPDVEL